VLVEIVFQLERALPCDGIARIERRLGTALFERGDDVG